MKILDKYILTSFITTFGTVFVILFLIFILQTVWLFIGELAGKDLDVLLIIKFLIYKMPSVVPLVLPLSIVLASIMTFGNLSENYEFAAMKSAGISLNRAMRGLSVFIAILAIAAFAFANNIIPFAEYKFVNFRKNLAQVQPALAIAEGQFNDVGDYNIKVNKKSGKDGRDLEGITIHKKSKMDTRNSTVIKAKTGELISSKESSILQLVLNDGYYYEDVVPKNFQDRNKVPFAKSSFKKYTLNIDLSTLTSGNLDETQISNTNNMLTVDELSYTIDSLNVDYTKELKAFADNSYTRTGILTPYNLPVANVNLPAVETKALPANVGLLELFEKPDQIEILKVANSFVLNSSFGINSSKIEYENKQRNINNHWIAFYEKFVIAFSCFLMFFIGAPLGAIIRKGGLGLPIVFAVLIFIIFHFINTFGKKIAQEDEISPFLGTWMSSIVLTPLAVLLTYRATNDIGLINFDRIIDPIQKIFRKLIPQKKI